MKSHSNIPQRHTVLQCKSRCAPTELNPTFEPTNIVRTPGGAIAAAMPSRHGPWVSNIKSSARSLLQRPSDGKVWAGQSIEAFETPHFHVASAVETASFLKEPSVAPWSDFMCIKESARVARRTRTRTENAPWLACGQATFRC